MEQLYLELKATLLAKGIKTVQFYSNQINRLTSTKNGTGVIGFPAVLIEFSNIKYVTLSNGQQQYTAVARLYTVCYSLEDVGLKMFAALRTVHGVAEGFNTEFTNGLNRIAEDTDNDFTNTAVTITDYQFRGWFAPIAKDQAELKEINITGEVRYIL